MGKVTLPLPRREVGIFLSDRFTDGMYRNNSKNRKVGTEEGRNDVHMKSSKLTRGKSYAQLPFVVLPPIFRQLKSVVFKAHDRPEEHPQCA